jgi:hypothetical protein
LSDKIYDIMNNRTTSTIQKQSTTLAQSSSSMILLIVIVAVLVHHHNVDAFAIVKTHHHHQLFVSTEIETKTVTTACHDQARKYRSAASQQHVLVLSSSSSSLEGEEEEEEVEDDDSDSLKENDDKEDDAEETTTSLSSTSTSTSTSGFRDRVQKFATRIVTKPYRLATTVPDPSAIGQVIKDASYAAVEEVEKEVTSTLLQRSSSRRISSSGSGSGRGSGSGNGSGNGNSDNIIQSIVDDAFKPMEESLIDMEESLTKAKQSLIQAKVQSYDAIETLQLVALEQQQQAENSVVVMEAQREAVIEKIREVKDTSGTGIDLSELTFDDIDYESSEMAKPFLDFDSCLMTDAEPVVRVEKAPDNSRRIFAGIDILASTDDVWSVSSFCVTKTCNLTTCVR